MRVLNHTSDVDIYLPDSNLGLTITTDFRNRKDVLMIYTSTNGYRKLIGHLVKKDNEVIFEPISLAQDTEQCCENCLYWTSHSEISAPYIIKRCSQDNCIRNGCMFIAMTRPNDTCKLWEKK
jgi:hypothetical protein